MEKRTKEVFCSGAIGFSLKGEIVERFTAIVSNSIVLESFFKLHQGRISKEYRLRIKIAPPLLPYA